MKCLICEKKIRKIDDYVSLIATSQRNKKDDVINTRLSPICRYCIDNLNFAPVSREDQDFAEINLFVEQVELKLDRLKKIFRRKKK